MIPKLLYRGTSYHELRVLTYPKRPSVDELLRVTIFNFPFVDDVISALHMAAEAAVNDKSIAAIVVATGINCVVEDSAPPNGTYKKSYHLDFDELSSSNLEIFLEGRDLEKLQKYDNDLNNRRIKKIMRDARIFSRRLQIIVPEPYIPSLRTKSCDSRAYN